MSCGLRKRSRGCAAAQAQAFPLLLNAAAVSRRFYPFLMSLPKEGRTACMRWRNTHIARAARLHKPTRFALIRAFTNGSPEPGVVMPAAGQPEPMRRTAWPHAQLRVKKLLCGCAFALRLLQSLGFAWRAALLSPAAMTWRTELCVPRHTSCMPFPRFPGAEWK
jgi:hypothetical protein